VQTGVDLLTDDDLWLCSTCGNCLRVCPKEVDMIQIMPAVREAALSGGTGIPGELQDVFEKTFRYGNALGENARRRAQWARTAGVPVRILPSDPGPVVLRRGLLELPPARAGRGAGVRPGGHRSRHRLGDPGP